MLTKKQRLTTKEFKTLFEAGKKVHTPLYSVVYVPSSTFHASVVVSKKVARRAVDRNAMRRRVYSIVQNYTQNKGTFIFLMKKKAFEVEYAVLKEGIQTFLNKSI